MEAPKTKPATGSLDLIHPQPPPPPPTPFWKMILVASIAAGIQFSWALQLSLLTPYVQQLGVHHQWASLVWLCGPVTGLLVQPSVGYYSDRCTSRLGRRRPFIAVGTVLVAVAFCFIGFSADIGHLAGDRLHKTPKPRAIVVYVIGFWILDAANNMLQGPCRAFLADLAASDQSKTRSSFSFFAFFMAVGNVVGFATASSGELHRLFPFSMTDACDDKCANVKSYVFINIAVMVSLAAVASCFVAERPLRQDDNYNRKNDELGVGKSADSSGCCTHMPFLGEIFGALKDLKRPMWILMLVTALNWVAWFPFILYNTDWMGREVYGATDVNDRTYDAGVHEGALGLVLNSVVLGAMSLAIEPLSRLLGGVKRLWGVVNLVLAFCLAMMVVISKMAEHTRHHDIAAGLALASSPPGNIKGAALAVYALLGIPLAITYSVPFALASIFSASSGAGQGLSLGVLNLAIVVPQMFVSTTNGPWDKLFGGGNLPAFVFAAVAAAASSLLAFTLLPSPPPDAKLTVGVGGGH